MSKEDFESEFYARPHYQLSHPVHRCAEDEISFDGRQKAEREAILIVAEGRRRKWNSIFRLSGIYDPIAFLVVHAKII